MSGGPPRTWRFLRKIHQNLFPRSSNSFSLTADLLQGHVEHLRRRRSQHLVAVLQPAQVVAADAAEGEEEEEDGARELHD